MHSNEVLRSLGVRLEQCSGADPELDAAIHIALGRSGTAARHYTGSVDAAMSLIPDDHHLVELRHLSPSSWIAQVGDNVDDASIYDAEAPTAAIAVAISALKVRQAP